MRVGLRLGFGEDELGFRTRGFGRTHDRLRAGPQRWGLSEREEGEIVSKKFPEGTGPEMLLWEMLKERRFGRLERFVGSEP